MTLKHLQAERAMLTELVYKTRSSAVAAGMVVRMMKIDKQIIALNAEVEIDWVG